MSHKKICCKRQRASENACHSASIWSSEQSWRKRCSGLNIRHLHLREESQSIALKGLPSQALLSILLQVNHIVGSFVHISSMLRCKHQLKKWIAGVAEETFACTGHTSLAYNSFFLPVVSTVLCDSQFAAVFVASSRLKQWHVTGTKLYIIHFALLSTFQPPAEWICSLVDVATQFTPVRSVHYYILFPSPLYSWCSAQKLR